MTAPIIDPDIEMPVVVQERHCLLNRAAIECYQLRNALEDEGRSVLAGSLEEVGDIYLYRAMALSEEWAI